MSRRWVIALAVAGISVFCSGPAVHAGTNQTYVNNDSPTVAGYLQIGETADYWWANSFTAPAGGEYLTQLDASFDSGFASGTPVTAAVYEDPSDSNNPNDLVLLTQTSGTVNSNGQYDLFTPQAFNIPATYVSGDYFVAMEINNAPASAYGPVVSGSKPVGRGFMAFNLSADAGTMTPATVNNADQPPASADVIAGASSPTYNLYIGAKGRATQYAEAQDPMLFDGFNTGNFSISSNGIQVSASDAIGGNRIATIATPNGAGSVSVANGVLTLNNCQASIAYGCQYVGGSGFQAGYNSYMHANASGYDTMQFHFMVDNTGVLIGNFGAASPTMYTTDANGNVDFNISAQDWTDLNTFSFTIYSYNTTVELDSITLLTNPIPGDVNGDGVLNADDYALIDHGLAAGLTGHINGDLNGDGVVDYKDYLIIDTAFADEYGLSQDLINQREAEFGPSYVAELEAAVPEPASLGIFSLAIPLMRRRRN